MRATLTTCQEGLLSSLLPLQVDVSSFLVTDVDMNALPSSGGQHALASCS